MAVPPVFVSGQVLTAAQMNAIGLWLVKSQTIGSGVSTVTVTNAFSADYDDYIINVSGGVASTGNNTNLQLGSTTSGYCWAITSRQYSSATVGTDQSNTSSQFAYTVRGTTNNLNGTIWVYSPFLAVRTQVMYQSVGAGTTDYIQYGGGFLNNATSYTDFTLLPNTGTITGGTINVYGIRK